MAKGVGLLVRLLEKVVEEEEADDSINQAYKANGVKRRSSSPPSSGIVSEDIVKSPNLKHDESFLDAVEAVGGFNFTGRQTQPSNYNFFANMNNGGMPYFFVPKKEPQQIAIEDIDSGAWTPGGLINVLIDISPDVSKALSNKLRISGTSVSFKAVNDGGEDDVAAQKYVDEAIQRIAPTSGGIDTFLIQGMLSLWVYGALATDSEIGLDLESTNDLFVVLPDSIWFQRDINQKAVPFQLQYMLGNFTQGPAMANFASLPYRRLNTASFKYTPLDPTVDDPYGRGPFWPVLQVIFFLAQLLRDLQRVVENQAWPHTDFSVEWDILEKMMERIAPSDLNSPTKIAKFVQSQMDIIKSEYSRLSPQDAYVHPSFVTVNTANAASPRMFDVPAVINIVRAQIANGLKELPLFMGMENTGSADGSTEFEIYVHDIERVRDIVTDHVAFHCALNCWMNGIQTNVVGTWRPIRTTQRLADAQSRNVELENAQIAETMGYQTHDQSAQEVTGTDAVSEPDWDHVPGFKKQAAGTGEVAGSTGSVAKGEDKATSQNTNKGTTKPKNAREAVLV